MQAEESDQKMQEKKGLSPVFAAFLQSYEGADSPETKIQISLEFMRLALSSEGTPRFKEFWEGRKRCLPLFKESMPLKVRAQLWSVYIELAEEAKRLKEILDEQSAFAVEQIELAIQGMERELEHYSYLLENSHHVFVSSTCFSLKGKQEEYNRMQNELQLLSTLASRVNALRKEVVKTEMRVRIKLRLLERLSRCGDQIFPKRKELIQHISDAFLKDVERFVASHFSQEGIDRVPLYVLREEIKALQSLAKVLTLSTHAFTQTRLALSSCWEKMKESEKEKRVKAQEKKALFKQNYELVQEKIRPFAEKCQGEISLEECRQEVAALHHFMKTLALGKEEIHALKEEIDNAQRAPLERAREQEQARRLALKQIETERHEKVVILTQRVQALLSQVAALPLDALISEHALLVDSMAEQACTKGEKQVLERYFMQLRDCIDEKKQRALLDLSEEDLKALEQLESALEEKKVQREGIKQQLEQYRKILGGSGFDFEKAMLYRERIEDEKERLSKVSAAIDEIEDKIAEIEE